jgi:hypothetical protein
MQAIVTNLVVGPDARRLDRDLDSHVLQMVRIDVGTGGHVSKVPTHRHHAEMLRRELHLRVIRVELPVAHLSPSSSFPDVHVTRTCRVEAVLHRLMAGSGMAARVEPGGQVADYGPVVDVTEDR